MDLARIWRDGRRVALVCLFILPVGLTSGVAPAADSLDVEFLQTNGHCSACDLSGAQLDAMAFLLTDLSFADLSGASLYRVILTDADFSSAILSGANLQRSSLEGALFTGADLTGANLIGANLADADLLGAITDATTLTDDTTTCPNGIAGPCEF